MGSSSRLSQAGGRMLIDGGRNVAAFARAPVVARPKGELAPVEVWVPGSSAHQDALARESAGPSSTNAIVEQAYETGVKVLDYVRREFERDSYDGAGSTLRLRAHSIDPISGTPNNAFWDHSERRIWLGDGDGTQFSPLGAADDVVAHEFLHAVIDHEIRLDYVEQEGAIHESFADVLATGIDGNWTVAERVFTPNQAGDALRDLAKPEYTKFSSIPIWQSDTHKLAEVPSYAAYQVGAQIGMAEMRRIWYSALTSHMPDHAGFAATRDATVAAAQTLYGAGSKQMQSVIDAWTAVGITSATPKK